MHSLIQKSEKSGKFCFNVLGFFIERLTKHTKSSSSFGSLPPMIDYSPHKLNTLEHKHIVLDVQQQNFLSFNLSTVKLFKERFINYFCSKRKKKLLRKSSLQSDLTAQRENGNQGNMKLHKFLLLQSERDFFSTSLLIRSRKC